MLEYTLFIFIRHKYGRMSFPLGNSFYENDRLSAKPITRFCNDSNC